MELIEAPVADNCQAAARGERHYRLIGNADTVHWGYFSKSLAPVLTINSKDQVTMDLITHHAGDDYDRMIKGDPGIESIYRWNASQPAVANRGPGVHILTGPVKVSAMLGLAPLCITRFRCRGLYFQQGMPIPPREILSWMALPLKPL